MHVYQHDLMPELAETFTVAAQLASVLGVHFETDSDLCLPSSRSILPLFYGQKFTLCDVDPAVVLCDSSIEEEIQQAIPIRVQHKGKKIWMIWRNEREEVIEIEIRLAMTGTFSLLRTPHTRAEFWCDKGSLFYNDVRKFGVIARGGNDVSPSCTGRLNVDQVVADLCRKEKTPVKEALVDQKLAISGIGNYVANEACHAAGIHPRTEIGALSHVEIVKLLDAARKVIRMSVAVGGCTLRDFVDLLGRPGEFQHHLKAYKQETCECGRELAVLRSKTETTSWVCSLCQPLKASLFR